MKITIKSKLEGASEQIFHAANWQVAKELLLEYVKESEISDKDKRKMLDDVNRLTNLIKIQQYFCNSLLKYEGLSTKTK